MNDPLLLTCVKFLEEERAKLLETLETRGFDNLYDLGVVQGQLRGIALARQAIEDASRALDEE